MNTHSRGAATGANDMQTPAVAPRLSTWPTTDLGLKSEAITCRCSATLCFKSADDSQLDALVWLWTYS